MAAHDGRNVRDLRRENRAAVLRRSYLDGPMSRFSLAPATGLSSGSISNVVAELLTVGIDLGALGPDAVTVGAAILPLAAFFARGGRRLPPTPAPEPSTAWRATLDTRLA